MKTTNRKLILSLIGALIVICAFGVSIYAVNARITLMGDELSDSQRSIVDLMLNSMDHFDNVSGFFNYQRKGYIKHSEFKINIGTNDLDTEFYELATGDHYECLNVCVNGKGYTFNSGGEDKNYTTYDYSKPQKESADKYSLKNRIVSDDNGIKLVVRKEPAIIALARKAIFPQEITYGFLCQSNDWSVIAREFRNERDCYVITVRLSGEYSDKIDVQTFTMCVDTSTGIVLELNGYNKRGECTIEMYFDAISFDNLDYHTVNKECSDLISDYKEICLDITYDFFG